MRGSGAESDVAGEKTRLRASMARARAALSTEDAEHAAERLVRYLLESEVFSRAKSLALYAAQDGEPDLRGFYEAARGVGKTLFLPRCEPGRRLAFHQVQEWSDLEPGRFGLLEPRPEWPEEVVGAVDLVLVPALAVDEQGRRLGRGGGWYDQSLSGAGSNRGTWLAVVHDFQRVRGAVPADERDQRVDGCVTEAGFFWCGNTHRPPIARTLSGGDSAAPDRDDP